MCVSALTCRFKGSKQQYKTMRQKMSQILPLEMDVYVTLWQQGHSARLVECWQFLCHDLSTKTAFYISVFVLLYDGEGVVSKAASMVNVVKTVEIP